MGMTSGNADIAERAAWGRARAATVMAIVFVTAQAGSFHDEVPLSRPQTLHLSAWVVWAAALLFFLAWGGGLLRGRRIRAVLNDETTLDHRRRAMVAGFWGAIGTSFLVYALTFYEPVTAREGVRLVITFTVALALLRFGTLERRALRGG
jgi:protein-S-isoprenylcysteine O-methyltransferase Ste14